jgi:hypothetical protein
MHGNTAHYPQVQYPQASGQATTLRTAWTRLHASESPCQLAIRALPKEEEEGTGPFAEAIHHERIALSASFSKNLARFAEIVLPREAVMLEVLIFPSDAMVPPLPVGPTTAMGSWSILTEEEVARVAPWLLNKNARHFLEYARPDRFSGTAARLETFRRFMSLNGLRGDEVVLDSSMVLELYGLRKAVDMDYLALGETRYSVEGISTHDRQVGHHGLSKSELITNPDWYFEYNGIRLLSFAQVKRFKQNRNTPKDRHDVGMMEALEKKEMATLLINRGRYEYLVRSARVKSWAKNAIRMMS